MNPQQTQPSQSPQPAAPQNNQSFYQSAYQQSPSSVAPQASPAQPAPPPQPTRPAQPVHPSQQTQPISPQPSPHQSPVPQTPQAPQAAATASQQSKGEPLATQTNLLISELRDGLVIMKDGSFRAVIACKSINFDLMSETEREGVEYSYQSFLNSLEFTVQILIRSQRVDIGPYLERLSEIRRNNDNMLLGVLMDDYINFIDILSQEANIMDKSFFIVIPYYTSVEAEKATEQSRNFFTLLKNNQSEVTRIDRTTYDKAVTEMNTRVDSVISGLFQIGIHSVRLNTKELSELYYNFNNPDTAVREPFIDFDKMAKTYVRGGTTSTQGATNQGGTNG